MNTFRLNDEVLYTTDEVVQLDSGDIRELKRKAKVNSRRRIRICVHRDVSELIHEMLIIHEKTCYVKPHKHINKTESFHIIDGLVDIILFNEDGSIKLIIPMGDYKSGRKFFYRLPPSIYHTLLIQSDVLVFHEITNGPFRPQDTVWAPWAPFEHQIHEVEEYRKLLERSLKDRSTT